MPTKKPTTTNKPALAVNKSADANTGETVKTETKKEDPKAKAAPAAKKSESKMVCVINDRDNTQVHWCTRQEYDNAVKIMGDNYGWTLDGEFDTQEECMAHADEHKKALEAAAKKKAKKTPAKDTSNELEE